MAHICQYYGNGCNVKKHRNEKTAQKHHERLGLIRKHATSRSNNTSDILDEIHPNHNSSTLSQEQEELVEDFRDAYQAYDEKKNKLEQEAKEIKNKVDSLRYQLDNFQADPSLSYVEQLRKQGEFQNDVFDEIGKLEKKKSSLEIEAKFGDVYPDVDLTELNDDEFQLAVDTLAQIYRDEVKKPEPYVDPFPDKPGKHAIVLSCPSCGGTGRYDGHGGDHFVAEVKRKDGSYGLAKACYQCEGEGKVRTTTSKIRASKKRKANALLKEYEESLQDMEKIANGKLQRQRSLQLQNKGEPVSNPVVEKRQETLQGLREAFPIGEKTQPQQVKVKKVKKYTSRYGGRPKEQKIITFDTGQGYDVVWFTTANNTLETGQSCTITGTVKKVDQNDYDNSLQVVMNRIKATGIE